MVFAAGLTRLLVLLDWNKADLGGDLLAGGADGEVEELLRQASRIAVRVVKGRARVRIGLGVDALDRRKDAVNRHDLDPARLRVGETDVADAVRVLPNFVG